MKPKRMKYRLGASIIVICSCVIISPAMAANYFAAPSLSVEERWDTNIFNSPDNTVSDFIFRARPQLTLSLETYEARLNLTGGVALERYSKHDELNGAAVTDFNLSTDKPFQLTPIFSLQPSARYMETKDSVSRNVLTQQPTPGLPPSETAITTRTKVREYSASLQMIYLLTPNVDLGFGGGATRREFVEDTPGLVGSKTLSGNATVSYRFTPLFSSGFSFGAGRNTFDDNTSSNTYSPQLTASYSVSENYTIHGGVGATYVTEQGRNTNQKTGEWSPAGQLSLVYAGKSFQATLMGSYDISGGGSFGVTTKRGNIFLALTDQFAQRWWWDLSSSYQINRSTDSPRTEDLSTVAGSAGIRYQAAEWAIIRLAGDTTHQRAHTKTGTDLDRNTVFIGVDVSKDFRLF